MTTVTPLEKARSTLEQALFLAQRVGNAEEQTAALINLGYVLSKLGETEAALQMDRDALVAFESVGIKAGVACVYCNLAEKLYGSGRWKESKAAALNGLAVAEEINNPYWITGGADRPRRSRARTAERRGSRRRRRASCRQRP